MGSPKRAHKLAVIGTFTALTLAMPSVWGMGWNLNDSGLTQAELHGMIVVGITMLLPSAVWVALAAARALMKYLEAEAQSTDLVPDAQLTFDVPPVGRGEAVPRRCAVELAPGAGEAIAHVTRVVEGLAFQAHMLALNAVVEATRAGDHGQGFTVVAGEVRQLAQRAAEAAKQLKQLTVASAESAAPTPTLVPQANVSMQEVVASIRRVTETSWQK